MRESHGWAGAARDGGRAVEGLCARGSALLELTSGTARRAPTSGTWRARGGRERRGALCVPRTPARSAEVFARMTNDAARRGPVLVVADGALPCEDLAAMQRWAEARRDDSRVALHLPPTDVDLLEGLFAAGAPLVSSRELGSFDALVIVGDALATHPGLGRAVMDWKYKKPRRTLVVMDTVPGTTARFAGAALIVPPDGHVDALERLRVALAAHPGPEREGRSADLAEAVGLSPQSAGGLVERLARAGRVGWIVAPEATKSGAWDEVAMVLAALAECTAGAMLPLYACGNALGAWRVARNAGMPRLDRLLASVDRAWAMLVFIGVDPTLTYAPSLLAPLYRGAPSVVILSAVETPLWQSADLAMAMCTPAEYAGTALAGHGEKVTLAPMGTPMRDCVAPGMLFGAATADASELWQPLASVMDAPRRIAADGGHPAPHGVMLQVSTSPLHAGDASLTAGASWMPFVDDRTGVGMHPALAREIGVAAGEPVRARRNGGSITLPCALCDHLPENIVTVPSHLPEVRWFLPWRPEMGRLSCGPPRVELERVEREVT